MGVFGEFFFVPKATWTAADVPDLSGRVFVVTGGASGIGRETVKESVMYEVDHGAITPLWAATAPEAEDVNGKVRTFSPWARVGQAAKEAEDPETGKRLWTWLEDCVRKFEEAYPA